MLFRSSLPLDFDSSAAVLIRIRVAKSRPGGDLDIRMQRRSWDILASVLRWLSCATMRTKHDLNFRISYTYHRQKKGSFPYKSPPASRIREIIAVYSTHLYSSTAHISHLMSQKPLSPPITPNAPSPWFPSRPPRGYQALPREGSEDYNDVELHPASDVEATPTTGE